MFLPIQDIVFILFNGVINNWIRKYYFGYCSVVLAICWFEKKNN